MNGKLKKNTSREVATLFSVSMRTVQRVWKRSKENMKNGVTDVSHKRTKNCGRKRIQIDLDHFRSIPLQERKTIRDAANALKVSTSVLSRNLKSGDIRRHSNAIKPFLSEENKKGRLQFCLDMLDKESLPHDPKFHDMQNVIHIDEKWFDLSKKCETYYLLADEEEPHRTCKSKNFVTKVMFLAAVARPRFDGQGNVTFSGKIGIYPFITKEPAKRSSVNRVAGTLETKAMTSVKRDTVRSYLIEKVIRDIRAKWPREDMHKLICIQQDNARTHVDPKDIEFCQAAQQSGFDIQLMCQPPNSPDMNVLDLGFFRALQSLRYKKVAKTIDDLVNAVEETFENYPVEKLNNIFLTLQLCMMETMKVKGSNAYKLPHIGKDGLERRGQLPIQIKCDAGLVNSVYEFLNEV